MTRAVKKGESVSLWFSTSLQAAIGIPFLTPSNILGEKNYVCHHCRECFEYPNPLKVHLALDCGRLRTTELWERMSKSSDTTNNNAEPPFDLSALSLKKSPPSPAHSCYSNPSPQPRSDGTLEDRPSSEPPHSAFRPYLKADHGESVLSRRAAEIEAFVSSLGQSKQGHLCLYCGKLYSRKYGLKIHIRTHTGFKPLKCKYCLRPFGDPSNLNKHVRLHAEGDTPYRCELCGKMLVRRRDLDRHMKARHNINECTRYQISNV
ncbi:unnamed protein product [Nezara viridula]|uniref:C2H2-type domain-containing protein n=1 Tax=Nezara viridula TaxID=85310 RepID=A0A9P0E1Z0_NEZVI|nr:unnamed protein product [Nezara viridula]